MTTVAALTLLTLGAPVEIDPAGVSDQVIAKANRLAKAGLLSREHATDAEATYLVGGDNGTYYVRLTLESGRWVGECEHPARLAEQGTPVARGSVCSHIWLAALVEAKGRGLAIPRPSNPPCPYPEFLAAWRRHQSRADQPGDAEIIGGWQRWRARRGQEARP